MPTPDTNTDTDTDSGTDRDRPLRLSLTLPGSASLGAYQAGATAALAVMIHSLRRSGHAVHLDAIGGSSAGSIVSVLFAHCLMSGRDAPSLLRTAWVDEVDVELLRSGDGDSPLAFDELRERLVSFLSDRDEHPVDVHERMDTGGHRSDRAHEPARVPNAGRDRPGPVVVVDVRRLDHP